MTPEEKAKELIDKFEKVDIFAMTSRHEKETPKQCALVCVDEIEKALTECGELSDQLQNMDREFSFWDNVKSSINQIY